jgi:hypothetical protein
MILTVEVVHLIAGNAYVAVACNCLEPTRTLSRLLRLLLEIGGIALVQPILRTS